MDRDIDVTTSVLLEVNFKMVIILTNLYIIYL